MGTDNDFVERKNIFQTSFFKGSMLGGVVLLLFLLVTSASSTVSFSTATTSTAIGGTSATCVWRRPHGVGGDQELGACTDSMGTFH